MKKGFTMIELIFVIVILGILASVAIPRLAATRADAEISAALANIRTFLSDAAAFYTARGDFIDPNNATNNVTYAAFTNVPFWYGGLNTDGKSSQKVGFIPDDVIKSASGTASIADKLKIGANGLNIVLKTGSRKSACLGMEFAGSNGRASNNQNNSAGYPLIVVFHDLGATDTTCRAIINSQEIQNYLNNKVSLIDKTFDAKGNVTETLLEIPNAILVGQSASVYGRATGTTKP